MSDKKGEVFLVLLAVIMIVFQKCEGRAVMRNLYNICPRRHSKPSDVALQHITDLCNTLRKKMEQLQDDYHTSNRISHGDRQWLESIKSEKLPSPKSYEKEEEMIFQMYHGLVTYVYFLELSQNEEYYHLGEGDQSYYEEFKDIVSGHHQEQYTLESLLCELTGLIHRKGLWETFQRQQKVGEEVLSEASNLDTRQAQLHRDYIVLEHAVHYLNHIRNKAQSNPPWS